MQSITAIAADKTTATLISVIVPHYNDAERLEVCLTAILAQDHAGSVEVIVVDNGSTRSIAAIEARFPSVLFLSEPSGGSYAARNCGLSRCRGEFAAFTDSDCIPEPGWLSLAVARLVADPTIDAVGGDVRVFPLVPGRPNIYELYDSLMHLQQRQYVERQGYAATANLVARRSAFDRVGPFDGSLMSNGDNEWGTRLTRADGRIVFEGLAVVRHPARATYREVTRKIRRIVVGSVARDPAIFKTVSFVVRKLFGPPLSELSTLVRSGHPLHTALIVRYALLAMWLRWLRAFYRIDVHLFRRTRTKW